MAKTDLENPTGLAELDAALKSLSKTFGKDMSGEDYGDVETHTSGSLTVDIWTKRGGIPTGTLIEVFGGHKTMKTTFCLLALAARQRWRKEQGITNKKDLIADVEHSIERRMLVDYGVDMDQVIWKRFDTAEEALESCRVLGRTGAIDYVVFDSIDALQNVKQQGRKVGDNDVGGISKDMNFALRDLSKIATKTNTTYLFINQIKMNPGVMFGNPETTPGGKAMEYYATFRIKMLSRKACPDIAGATLIRLRGVKSKMASDVDWEDIEVAVIPGKGYVETYEINQLATKWGIIRHSAGQTKVKWTADSDGEPLHPDIPRGKAGALEFIETHEPTKVRLKNAVLRAAGIDGAITDQEVLDMFPGEFEEGTADDYFARMDPDTEEVDDGSTGEGEPAAE